MDTMDTHGNVTTYEDCDQTKTKCPYEDSNDSKEAEDILTHFDAPINGLDLSNERFTQSINGLDELEAQLRLICSNSQPRFRDTSLLSVIPASDKREGYVSTNSSIGSYSGQREQITLSKSFSDPLLLSCSHIPLNPCPVLAQSEGVTAGPVLAQQGVTTGVTEGAGESLAPTSTEIVAIAEFVVTSATTVNSHHPSKEPPSLSAVQPIVNIPSFEELCRTYMSADAHMCSDDLTEMSAVNKESTVTTVTLKLTSDECLGDTLLGGHVSSTVRLVKTMETPSCEIVGHATFKTALHETFEELDDTRVLVKVDDTMTLVKVDDTTDAKVNLLPDAKVKVDDTTDAKVNLLPDARMSSMIDPYDPYDPCQRYDVQKMSSMIDRRRTETGGGQFQDGKRTDDGYTPENRTLSADKEY